MAWEIVKETAGSNSRELGRRFGRVRVRKGDKSR